MIIFHTYLNDSSFVKKDRLILQESGSLTEFEFHLRSKPQLPWVMLRQLLYLCLKGWNAQLFITQFAGYHSFLPCLFAKLTGKKSIIVAGGTDCVGFPGIGYGNFNRPFLRSFTKWSYQLCNSIAPKHESLWFCTYDYDHNEPDHQGIRAFMPTLNEKHTVIPNGYDLSIWQIDPTIERHQKHFITVSGAFEYPFQVELKGIDLILKTAPHFPDCQFTILGVPHWKKLDILSTNVNVLPPVKNNELPRLFSSYGFYLQLSMAEGFPNTLCEAMLCGCTPIVSKVFSMPEIVQETGFILNNRNDEELRILLEKACVTGPTDPQIIRSKIMNRFGIEKRRTALQALIKQLVRGK